MKTIAKALVLIYFKLNQYILLKTDFFDHAIRFRSTKSADFGDKYLVFHNIIFKKDDSSQNLL